MKERTPNDALELLEEANRIKKEALDKFTDKACRKYDNGQREHGGLITNRVTLEDLEDEIIDLWFYLQALRVKLGSEELDSGIITHPNTHSYKKDVQGKKASIQSGDAKSYDK